MDDSAADTSPVMVTVTVPDSEGTGTQTTVPRSTEPTAAVVEDKQSPTVVFIPPKNGNLGNPLLNSSTRLLQTIDGAVIAFRDVCYEVQTTVRTHGCRCRKEPKHVLKNVSAVFRPGVNAILGPTGSGKSTLLDILAGRKSSQYVSGDIVVDGDRQPRNFKYMSGYVVQDDVVMGMLTVRENIEFSAALRLPTSTTQSQQREKVNEVIADLGLLACANTRVGTEFVRGVSGGERKRTNIAMELISSPRVLFLDEPTTGLDASTAYSVMHLLQRLSRRGMTVILSIHQPRYSIYKLFDTLMLLHEGESVYHGPAAETLDFFASADYVCEAYNNPPDFFLDVLNGNVAVSAAVTSGDTKRPNGLHKADEDNSDVLALMQDAVEEAAERHSSLVQLYQQSTWHKTLETELQSQMKNVDSCEGRVGKKCRQARSLSYRTSAFTQMRVVANRTWNNMVRNRHALLTQMFSAVILGLIVGSIYFQLCSSCDSGIQNRIGAFFFIVMNYVFGNMSAVDVFIKERAVFIHETVSGYYRMSAYFLAKLFCDVMPQRVFPIVLFAIITYFMIGFQSSFSHFAFYFMNIVLTSLAGCSVALVFSASTQQHSIGTILTALIWVCMMVFSGLLVKVSTVPQFLQWIKWFSIFRYSMNAFMVTEMKSRNFCGSHVVNSTEHLRCTTGEEFLSEQGIAHETLWDLWSNEVALLLIASAFLLLTYIQLRRTNTTR